MILTTRFAITFPATLLVMFVLVACKDNPVSSPLPPEMADYFPLKVGNQWTYSIYKYTDHAHQDYIWTTGTSHWEVVSVTATITLQETFNGMTVHRDLFSNYDTVFYRDAKYPFFVSQGPDSLIGFTFQSSPSPSDWIANVLSVLGFKRWYQADTSKSSIRTFNAVYNGVYLDSVIVQSSVGFKYIRSSHPSGGNFQDLYVDSLLSYQLK